MRTFKRFFILTTTLTIILASCTLAPLKCFLTFSDYRKTYNYNFSKEDLKNKIVEAYSYNESLLLKKLGKTLIENQEVNKDYRKDINLWLDKSNWKTFKSEIRQNTADTLNLTIGKHQSRKKIQFQVIVQGDNNSSSLTIHGFKYQQPKACKKSDNYYAFKLSKRIEKKFIDKLD